jgi:hypothetical protein
MLPSFGLVYSLYIATIATPVNKKKQKKQKKDSPGRSILQGRERTIVRVQALDKKMAARGKPTKNPCCLLASGICSLPAPRAVALTGQPEAICSGYFTRVAATPVTIVNAKIITMPA